MLRCPPSRINLTASDIAGLEQRLTARQSAHGAQPRRSNVRLSTGPCRPTRLAIVPAEDNTSRRRADSSSSEALLCNDELSDEGLPVTFISNEIGAWALDTPTSVQQQPPHQSGLCNDVARALGRVALQPVSPPKASPRRQVDSFYGDERDGVHNQYQRIASEAHSPSLSGTTQTHLVRTPVETSPGISSSPLGNRVLCEIEGDACKVERQPLSDPRSFSSARARRRNTRSQAVFHDSEDLQRFVYSRHAQQRVFRNSREAAEAPLPVPELSLPGEITESSINLALDPGAPVFVPRTRFGTATESSTEGVNVAQLEPQWGSLDSTRSPSDLRIRLSSEQNVDASLRPHYEPSQGSTDTLTEATNARLNDSAQPRHRRRSRTADQNAVIPPPTPNLERYPLLRPLNSLTSHRRTSGFHRRVPVPGRSFSRPSSSASHHLQAGVTFDRRQSSLQVRYVSTFDNDDQADQAIWIRSISPAFSTSSLSTPNLLHPLHSAPSIHSRTSSLSWNLAASGTTDLNRLPSMVSAASGISRRGESTRQSSREGLDAAAEFLRMRNSPLDDLTERFSRLAASRPRSVGRSWERVPSHRPKISLLTGDPFRQDSSPDPLSTCESTLPETLSDPIHQEVINEAESEGEDPVALSLALPPSSPFPSSSQATPSTPAIHSTGPSSPRSPLASRSSAKDGRSPESAFKRKPIPTVDATPKVKVYDDSKPPNTQPQTPADVSRSRRRPKTRSDTTVHESPIFVGRAIISSPPPIPERNPHRNTYPSATPPQTSQAQDAASIAATPRPPTSMNRSEHVRGGETRPRRQALRSSEQAENELEAHMQGLEEDRRTWLSRQEEGTLEVTPPREGRFERYWS